MAYQRIRQELSDFATYFLMPMPALLLPWRLVYRWYYHLAGKPWLFEARVKAACHNASKLLQIEDVRKWRTQHRLTLMIDHIDFWISWLQPRRAKRLLQITGTWPEHGPFVVIGTHYGCGFMLMRALHHANVNPFFIIRKTPAHHYREHRILQLYAYFRLRYHKKLFPGKCYHPGTYPRKLLRGLDKGDNILVLVDVPAEPGRPFKSFTLFGHEAYLDDGMFNLLIQRHLRYVTYQTSIDFDDGQRELTINSARQTESSSLFWSTMNEYINKILEQDNSQWHLWQVAGLYYIKHSKTLVGK